MLVIFLNILNGMLRHSLATLEGELEFIDFYRALLSPEGSPLSLVVGSCSLLPLQQCVCTLAGLRACSNSKVAKEWRIMYELSLFCST